MAKPVKKTLQEEIKEKKQKRANTGLLAGLQSKMRVPGVSEEEVVKSTKKYNDPGQWLGNKHPVTRV